MNRAHAPWRLWLIGAALALSAGWVAGESAPRSINQEFERPDIATWVKRFERPGREVYDRREQILQASGVAPGMVVADIGAGTGLFTQVYAERVGPAGKVYAVDISAPFVEHIRREARASGRDNVEAIVSLPTDTRLPAGRVDLAFTADTYHHFDDPRAMLASIRSALKPGGKFVVVDFRREPGRSSAWVLEHVRAGKDEVIREIEAAGFRLLEDRDFLKENYFLKFEKTG